MSEPVHDVAVIGGGVVGCAVLRRLALGGLSCVMLEKSADILSGASKGNSALLHTGFDAPTGSLELSCMQDGYREYLAIRRRAAYTLEYKLEAVRLVKGGQSKAVTAKVLGILQS